MANTNFLKRFFEDILGVIVLTVLSTMMVGMLLVASFYGLYVCLTSYGLSEGASLVTVIILAAMLTALFVGLALWRFKELKELSRSSPSSPVHPLARASGITHAFLNGFKSRSPVAKKN